MYTLNMYLPNTRNQHWSVKTVYKGVWPHIGTAMEKPGAQRVTANLQSVRGITTANELIRSTGRSLGTGNMLWHNQEGITLSKPLLETMSAACSCGKNYFFKTCGFSVWLSLYKWCMHQCVGICSRCLDKSNFKEKKKAINPPACGQKELCHIGFRQKIGLIKANQKAN